MRRFAEIAIAPARLRPTTIPLGAPGAAHPPRIPVAGRGLIHQPDGKENAKWSWNPY